MGVAPDSQFPFTCETKIKTEIVLIIIFHLELEVLNTNRELPNIGI
jgi:hypothetical protein